MARRATLHAGPSRAPSQLDAAGHSATRFHQRHRPDATPAAAEAELRALLPTATFVEDLPRERASIWQVASVLLVVSEHGTVKTVLPSGSQKPNRRPRR